MNKFFKPIFITAVFAVFGVVNAQEAAAPAATTPAAGTPAHTAAPAPATPSPAPAATTPAPAAAHAPAAPAPAPAATTPAPATAHTPAPAATHTPAPAPVAATPAPAPVAATPAVKTPAPAAAPVAATPSPAPATKAPAPKADSVAVAPKTDSNAVVLVVKEQQPKKKKRGTRAPKNDFAVVDVPANFEIQARKVMPVDSEDWGDDNLDTWWGRANLMVLTESENFVGKVHLRMYPGEFGSEAQRNANSEKTPTSEKTDQIQLYEAWAWHRGDYVNVKLGRWDNTTRLGSKTFGGYIDAKKDKDVADRSPNRNRRQAGFMSTYYPENAVQFGLNNFYENISLDIALISSDNKLNKGDLRTYFHFKDLAGIENMEIGLGYRSNIFDEIYSKYGDVTHTVDLAVRMPILKDIGILKDFGVFVETALIGIDDHLGVIDEADSENERKNRLDKGGVPNKNNPAFPVLVGLDISLYRGLDKVVIEAEYDGERRNATGGKEHVKDILGSIYFQKILNDRFTLNLGLQSENNTKDFSFAGRLQGRIN
jgi:hypothetical protein